MRILLILSLLNVVSCKPLQPCESLALNSFTHYQINAGDLVVGDTEFIFNVFDKPNGKIILNLPSDEETGWGVTIIDQTKDYFKIENIWRKDSKALNYWEYDWMPTYQYVWIKKGSVGLNTQNYDGQVINLYERPDSKLKVVGQFNNVQTVVVWEACRNWAYVEAKDSSGISLKGWLSPDDQCANPLTTCN